MDNNIRLKLVGITFNQIESGVYALILEDPLSHTRLPIVIGYPEAQSIECHLQKVKVPRPLSHDLLASIIHSLDAKVVRIDIHKLPSGPYAGKIVILTSLGDLKEIDARSSDAIALAIRVGAPIFTSSALLEKEGYKAESNKGRGKTSPQKNIKNDNLTVTQLEDLLSRYVIEENYEEAAKIKKELDKRRGDSLIE